MELRHIRSFVAVAEELNFHRAAKKLHVSQPPLTRTIQQLEEEIGAKLLLRPKERKHIELTEAGRVFLGRARTILGDTNQAIEEARLADRGIIGTLKLSFISSAIFGYLQEAIRKFDMLYPHVAVHMEQATYQEIIDDLEEDRIDVGIIRTPFALPKKITVCKEQFESYCVALPINHLLAGKKSVELEDIVEDPLIVFPRNAAPFHYDQIVSLYHERGLVPNFGQEAIEQSTIAALVASNMGVALVPESVRALKFPGVTHVTLKGPNFTTSLATISAHPEKTIIKNFLDVI